MDTNYIVQWGFQLVLTGALGWIGYFLKQSEKRQEDTQKKTDNRITDVEKDIADLKADLPFIYTTREDFIRTMNNVDSKLDRIYDKMLKGGGTDSGK